MIAGAAAALAPLARAEAYPSHTVKLVVGAPPGGPGDFLARLYGKGMGAALGPSFVVENRPGASGTLAAEAVVRAAADAHTLLVSGPAAISAAPHLMKLGYDPATDLVPVSMLGAGAFVLAVHPSVRARNVGELRDLARSRTRGVSYGSGGSGSSSHLCTELFCEALGVKMHHVPYKGEGQAVADLLSGEIQVMFTAPNVALRHARAGTLRLLAVTSRERMAGLPDVPTVAESGVSGFEYIAWQVVFAPAATPPARIATLVGAWEKARRAPELREQVETLGMAAPEALVSGEPLAAFLRAESARLGRLIRDGGIKAE
ncbi:tripartite tricarboxylate transporter substrate binding protein [Ramlibacter sp. USB13]|uniref:Tripartite tricarboxylate transporter substrate binding protein n=1 Tax=Ramlibacter cellulosilyticus TaxID=2764187 RepID=A0A923MLW7_9BURK|nr:tripartite tricarboxylate transporter substrate binding protein [Ramlibacter cellulosilyticus]MBC5781553.1 tripartite tricarboxylate transporter substrate binding protein [Ramlibacter cellulosilyticus]